ncbi:16S rRNA (cytosine(1402)-N(4))-methyltransferase RsmH [Candidatus Parcubacteria bacterium]|nr:16S rRNA (cytosine(1402)-N(4))-methyltransferase RsmH [Candidatus Parcubacteria bacterium]
MLHQPVLQKEVLGYLDPKTNENFIDCTIGLAGHSKTILKKNCPKGKILGIETDPKLYKKLLKLNLNRLILANDSYLNLEEIVKKEKIGLISGILFDLGVSSWHFEKSGRGFSFQKDEPLIMRYDWNSNEKLTAKEIINKWPRQEIERILREYGEEKFSKRIAKKICETRKTKPIKTTFELIEVIKKAVPNWYRQQKIHPATRTFQALRIAVNNELNNLEKTLPIALKILKPKGKLVIISFHSGEDRIVKKFLRENYRKGLLKILTKKPVSPTRTEIKSNPRSRSAKLRAAEKLL